MAPTVALFVWLVFLLLVVRYDGSHESAQSRSLWVPVLWIFLTGSRLPSQWLGLTATTNDSAFMEGSGIDRAIFLTLMLLALAVLFTRRITWSALVADNRAIALFLSYALLSVAWSDYPFITFKRWGRDLGAYVIVLVVLSDQRPLEATATVIRRVSYLLVFLSVVLIKYFPASGVAYDFWSGAPEYVGATTSKNMLGVVCLVSGLFFVSDILRRWPDRRLPGKARAVYVNVLLAAMTLWLLNLSNSATSKACLAVGCLLIVVLRTNWAKARPRIATALFPLSLVVYVVLDLTLDISALIAELLGRDATFHGRTGIWSTLLDMQTHPLIGVGYQSFWLGDRMAAVLRNLETRFLNESHNGYLEIYLALGVIGVVLLAVILLSSYRRLSAQVAASQPSAAFGLSLLSVMIVYNLSEAAFGASFLWIIFLLCTLVARPSYAEVPADVPGMAAETRGKASVGRSDRRLEPAVASQMRYPGSSTIRRRQPIKIETDHLRDRTDGRRPARGGRRPQR